jgi:hypothetical protein
MCFLRNVISLGNIDLKAKNYIYPYGSTAHIWALYSSVLRFLNDTQLDTRQDSSGWVISPSQRPLPTQDNTTHKHERQTSILQAGFEPTPWSTRSAGSAPIVSTQINVKFKMHENIYLCSTVLHFCQIKWKYNSVKFTYVRAYQKFMEWKYRLRLRLEVVEVGANVHMFI